MEDLDLIKVIAENMTPSSPIKLSDKYKGVLPKEDSRSFNEHTETMRTEWNNTKWIITLSPIISPASILLQ